MPVERFVASCDQAHPARSRLGPGLEETSLTGQLRELVKKRGLDYGIVVREVGSGSGANMEEQGTAMLSEMTGQGQEGVRALLAYKVYPDGNEELVRGARLSGVSAESFKNIVAASKSKTLFHATFTPQFNLASAFLFSSDTGMSI